MTAKPLRYTEKVVVMFSKEQLARLKAIAAKTGDNASGMLRRLALQYIEEQEK